MLKSKYSKIFSEPKTPKGGYIKERVHSEMKISDKIKLDPNIMPFAFFFSKSVSIPSDINSSWPIICGAGIHVGLGPHYPPQ